jgi:hypothetical protein
VAPSEDTFIFSRNLLHTSGLRVFHRLFLPFDSAFDIPFLRSHLVHEPAELNRILEEAGQDLSWRDSIRTTSAPWRGTLSGSPASYIDYTVLIHQRITLGTNDVPLILEETFLPTDRIISPHLAPR